MSLLSNAEIASLRGVAEMAMGDVCNVMRATSTKTLGNTVDTYDVSSANVMCHVSRTRRNAVQPHSGGAMRTDKMRDIRLPFGTDVTEKDRLNVTQLAGVAVNHTYEIMDIGDDSNGISLMVQARQIL
jgi:hypothetical protein